MRTTLQRLWLLAMMLCATLGARAYDACVNGIYYDFSETTATVTSGNNKYTGSVIIPASVTYNGNTYSVTSIGEEAFCDCSDLTSVTIPESVTSIGSYTFSDCTGLTSISIPNSVTSIGGEAFEGCSGLTKAEFASIGSLCGIQFNNTYANPLCYAQHLYIGGSEVTNLIIPNNVMSIGSYVFSGCSGLTSVSIPNSVTNIGDGAFSSCSSLTSISIPSSVISIGSGAFSGCSGLTSVSIPNSVTSIGSFAFSGCSGLTSVSIPNSVTTLKDGVFQNCTGLTSIIIPESVTSIAHSYQASFGTAHGTCAFKDCSNLTSVTINSNAIASGTFKPFLNSTIYEIKGLYELFGNQVKQYVFGGGVTSIASYACYNHYNLEDVVIGSSVTSIGSEAFNISLNSVTVAWETPISLNSSNTFSNASNATLYVPKGTKAAYEAANDWKNFKEIVESGEEGEHNIDFADNTVKALCVAHWDTDGDGELSFDEAAAVTYLDKVFDENEEISTFDELQYFTGLNSIASEFRNCSNLTSITIPENVASIGSGAFSGCSGLTSVSIPNSVTSIGSFAFSGCSGLTSVSIPNSVTSIGIAAFQWCTNLTTLTIGNSVTSIGDGAFNACKSLVSVNIPNSVTSIGESAFENCTGLTSITIPNSVTEIGNLAFEGCGLTSVAINNNMIASSSSGLGIFGWQVTEYIFGNDVQSIGSFACYGNGYITSIIIGNNVTVIGESAFENCTGLTSITIPNSVTEIGNRAFYHCIYEA